MLGGCGRGGYGGGAGAATESRSLLHISLVSGFKGSRVDSRFTAAGLVSTIMRTAMTESAILSLCRFPSHSISTSRLLLYRTVMQPMTRYAATSC